MQARETTQQAEWCTVVSVCMWSDRNNHGKIRINALSNTKWSINISSMSKSQMNISMKRRENSYLEILNQDKSINTINMSIPQVKTQELSMCNQETSTHWSTHQKPHLLHFKFKFDPLKKNPQRSRHFVDPAFRLMRFPLHSELNFYLKNDLLIKKMTWSRHLFLFYF